MRLIDSHTHLDFETFERDRDAVLDRARAAGVVGQIIAGVRPEHWPRQRALAARHPDIKWTAGLHPQVAAELAPAARDAALDALPSALDGEHPACAIGEIGLDRQFAPRDTLPAQRAAFRAQLALARERDVPVVLHIVATHGEARDILARDGLPRAGGVVHSYSGSADMSARYVELGLHIGFVATVLRPAADKAHRAARAVPLERLLIETDAPTQSPPGHPRRNEPALLPLIARRIAELRGADVDTIADATRRNAETLFGPFASIRRPPDTPANDREDA